MDVENIFQPRFAVESPYLADYFGLWMVHDAAILRAVERIQGMNLHLHMQSEQVQQQVSDRNTSLYPVSKDGIAQIAIRGPMMKAVPSMAEGTSTVRVRQQLKAARRDDEVRGIMLVMDTPGGTAKGNEDLANEVAAVAREKPVYVFVEDMTASAGVSVASMATRRYANNATAMYGSMGTYAVLYDQSGMAEQLGLKVHVIRAGEFKGMAEPGTEITDKQIDEIQRIVNRVNNAYLQTIANGLARSVDSIMPLADGRVIMAADAVSAGLINGIQSYEETYAELVETVSRRRTMTATRSTRAMADNLATLADLKATFPNSTAEWRESQLEAGVTLTEASVNYAKFIESRFAAEREKHAKELDEAKNAAKQVTVSSSLGHVPLTSASVAGDELLDSGDAIEDFNAAVASKLPKHRDASWQERQAAIALVVRTKPELHRAYLEATNAKTSRVKRLIAEKYEAAEA